MKNREARHTVLLPARMRTGNDWAEVSIHNVSAHGMLLQAVNTPRPGTYLEIRRATQVIIARTVWAKGHFFGIRTQDVIDSRALAQGRTAVAMDGLQQWNGAERRTRQRRALQHSYDNNRHRAMIGQFSVVVAAAAVAAAWFVFNLMPFLAETSAAISRAMAGTP